MLEQEVSNEVVILRKLKVEVAEMNVVKSNLVREINIQLLEARTQADKIIVDAKNKAQALIDEANKIKAEAMEYSTAQKQKADSLLHIAKSGIAELKEVQAELAKDKEEFNSLKTGHNQDIIDKSNRLRDIEEQQVKKQESLDSKERILKQRETVLNLKADELNLVQEELVKAREKFTSDRVELNNNIDAYNKNKLTIDAQKAVNEQVQAEIIAAQNKITVDTKANQELLIDIAKQKAEIAEQKKTINTQFEMIEKNRRELEEKELTLSEREQLLTIKNREIDDKIRVLQQLRGK